MIYIRGNRADYDRWRDEFGAAGWGFDDVLPYFVQSESNARLAGPWHGVDGPLRVEDPLYTHHLSRDWVAAAIDWGLPDNNDFNGATQAGAGLYQLTCRDGRRWSVADAYLHPVADRANLTVRTEATVTRILIENGAATGVVYRHAGVEQTARADGEVLLCAGVIASPQLLMLSGIGPAEHLREHDVEVLLDAPAVGAGLQDHASVPLVWHTHGTTDQRDLAESEAALGQWLSERRGPLTSNIAETGMFFSTKGNAVPDIQVHAGATTFWHDGREHSDRPGAGARPSTSGSTSTGPTWTR